MLLSEIKFEDARRIILIELLIKNRALLPPVGLLIPTQITAYVHWYFDQNIFEIYGDDSQDFYVKSQYFSADDRNIRLEAETDDVDSVIAEIRSIVSPTVVEKRTAALRREERKLYYEPDLTIRGSSTQRPSTQSAPTPRNLNNVPELKTRPYTGVTIHSIPTYVLNVKNLHCTGQTGSDLCPACGYFYHVEDGECIRCGFEDRNTIVAQRDTYVYVGYRPSTMRQYRRVFRPTREKAVSPGRSWQSLVEEYTAVTYQITQQDRKSVSR